MKNSYIKLFKENKFLYILSKLIGVIYIISHSSANYALSYKKNIIFSEIVIRLIIRIFFNK